MPGLDWEHSRLRERRVKIAGSGGVAGSGDSLLLVGIVTLRSGESACDEKVSVKGGAPLGELRAFLRG